MGRSTTEVSRASPDSANGGFELKPLSGTFGAEIRGIDLATLDAATFEQVYQLIVEHHVVVFRDQQFDPDAFLAFAERWGNLHKHPFMQGLESHPDILEIVKTESDRRAFGNAWHSDQMFNEKPAKFTMLYAREVPSRGGDTMFANMVAGYNSLSEGMQSMLQNLRGWNVGSREKLRAASSAPSTAKPPVGMHEQTPPEGLQTEASHPLVRTHQDSGVKSLYLGGHTMYIDGMTPEESAPILRYLQSVVTRPEFVCRVEWEVDSLTIWDNRCVQHYAVNDYAGERRRMHRITIAGDEVPVG